MEKQRKMKSETTHINRGGTWMQSQFHSVLMGLMRLTKHISRSTGASKHHFALCRTYFVWCFCSILPVRCGALFSCSAEWKCMRQTNAACVRVWVWWFSFVCMCVYVFACFLFWVRLRLSECTCVVWSYAACWLVVDIVIIRPLPSRSLYFLQCAFVFYIFNIPTHQIKRLGPNTQMQTAHPNTYYHITSIHKKKEHRTQRQKKVAAANIQFVVYFESFTRSMLMTTNDEAVADASADVDAATATNCAVSLPLFYFLFCFSLFSLSLSHPFWSIHIAILFTFCRAIIVWWSNERRAKMHGYVWWWEAIV